jgi:hypothetical protein
LTILKISIILQLAECVDRLLVQRDLTTVMSMPGDSPSRHDAPFPAARPGSGFFRATPLSGNAQRRALFDSRSRSWRPQPRTSRIAARFGPDPPIAGAQELQKYEKFGKIWKIWRLARHDRTFST